MTTLIVNLWRSLARFKSATLLNLFGLSIALAAFFIIMTQVRYDLTFDKGYSNSGKIYQVDLWSPINKEYKHNLSLFQIQAIEHSVPLIKRAAFVNQRNSGGWLFDARKNIKEAINEHIVMSSNTLPELFGLQWIEGNPSAFNTPNAALLSESASHRLFGDESPIGQQLGCILFTEETPSFFQVVGIYKDLPKNSTLPNGVIIHTEYDRNPNNKEPYVLYLQIDTPQQAEQTEQLLIPHYPEWSYHKDSLQTRPIRVIDLHDYYFLSSQGSFRNRGNRTTDFIMITISGLILLIAIINFINFSTALVPRRIRNINTRKVLGSSLSSLRFEQVAEAMILTLLAGIIALLIVSLIADTSFSSLFVADIHLTNNRQLISFTLGIALLCGLLAGLYPAFYSTSFATSLTLKGSFGLSIQGCRLRLTLIGLQYFISLTLIMVASYIYHQYSFMCNYNIGLSFDNIFYTMLSPQMEHQRDVIIQKLKENPNIIDITCSSINVAGDGSSIWAGNYRNQQIRFNVLYVTPNFPSFMQLPIIEGRNFRDSDQQQNGICLFNRTAQKQFDIKPGDPIPLRTGNGKIVGITEDFNLKSLYYSIEPTALYIAPSSSSTNKNSFTNMPNLYIKIHPSQIEKTRQYIEQTLLSFDPSTRNVISVEFLSDHLEQRYRSEKRLASLIFAFSLLAILICSVGAFGLILFETQYRRKEIALRKTFGATVADILAMFNRRYVTIVLICFVLAAPTAYFISTRWAQNFAYKASFNGWLFLLALAIVLLITLGTVTWQSYRSATENPAQAIKQE